MPRLIQNSNADSNFEQLRETVRQRYRIFPYLYTAARETYETGVGMNRPLYYEWPEENNAYKYEDEYMFGNDMLIAPIYSPAAEDGYSERNIWLPKGQWWDVTHNKLLQGDRVFRDRFTTDEFPVYYKPGAVIVNYPVQRTVQKTPTEIVLYVVPGADGTGRFYEDDGTNQDYQDATKVANTYFAQTRTEGKTELKIAARQGTFEGIPQTRQWSVIFLGQEVMPASVTINGAPVESTQLEYNEELHQLKVAIPITPCDQDIMVVVKDSDPSLALNL